MNPNISDKNILQLNYTNSWQNENMFNIGNKNIFKQLKRNISY